MKGKKTISTSIDLEMVEAGRMAVRKGVADNFGAWVNHALRRQVEYDRRWQALGGAISEYEVVCP